MIEDRFFEAFPFPCILFLKGADLHVLSGGSLFPNPVNSTRDAQIEYYREAKPGWSMCPLGYAVYTTDIAANGRWRLVVFGLKVRGVSKVRGKSETLNIVLNKDKVESCVKSYFVTVRESEEFFRAMVSAGVHDIRNINKDVYNAIYGLKNNLEIRKQSWDENLDLAKNIEALSQLLKLQADLFDCFSNPALLGAGRSRIPFYKAFDRIRKSLSPSALVKNVHLRMTGSSLGYVNSNSFFDVIPYVLLQNAIKYSPSTDRRSEVIVDVRENDVEIFANISSLGPRVEEDEEEKIFVAGFRGRCAKAVEPQGSGIGLYFAKTLIEMHNDASIKFFQDASCERVGNLEYFPTHFNLRFSMYREE